MDASILIASRRLPLPAAGPMASGSGAAWLTDWRLVNEARPRRLSVAVPSAPLLTVEVRLAENMGSLLRTSSTRVRPVCRNSIADTVVIGLIEISFGLSSEA